MSSVNYADDETSMTKKTRNGQERKPAMAWGFSFQYLTARAWSVMSALLIMLALVLSPFDVAQAHDMAHPVMTETAQTPGVRALSPVMPNCPALHLWHNRILVV